MSNRYYDAGPPASGQKVLLATTAYDSPDASYTYSIARSREALSQAGIQSAYYLLQGNCHVDDARNAVVRDFLDSDCTDLVFLDADVSWPPAALVELCGYDRDMVGGVYPYRREGGEENMPVRHAAGEIIAEADGLIEVEGLPTGFLRIRRRVLETMAEVAAKFRTKDEGGLTPLLFYRDTLGVGRRGGDIQFCMKWREMGGKLYAAPEMRLGHCGKHVIYDSLGASLRRRNGTTLPFVVDAIRKQAATLETYMELTRFAENRWSAPADILQLAAGLARGADGPVLEIGSGLTTIVMAAANPDQTIWCIEHDPMFALKTEAMARAAGLTNIALVTAEIKDRWYDLADVLADLPQGFALGVVDGPPRGLGDRMMFFDVFGERCKTILCDDADDFNYAVKLIKWACDHKRGSKVDGRAGVILPAESEAA